MPRMVRGWNGADDMLKIVSMELGVCPPEPVTDYTKGEENIALRGLSGVWYSYKCLEHVSSW